MCYRVAHEIHTEVSDLWIIQQNKEPFPNCIPSHAHRDVWLCKICSETRDLWMKTGAWFYKAIPKYEVPPPSVRTSNISAHSRLTASPTHGGSATYCRAQTAPTTPEPPAKKPIRLRIQCTDTSSDEDESAGTDSGWTSEHNIVRDRPSSCEDIFVSFQWEQERILMLLFRYFNSFAQTSAIQSQKRQHRRTASEHSVCCWSSSTSAPVRISAVQFVGGVVECRMGDNVDF